MAHPVPVAVLEQHVAILGKTGAGKSFAAKGIVERLLDAGERVCVIDPTGVWRGLRSNAAGDGPGYPVVVFGGKHGDLPLTGDDGERVARVVGTSTTPVVLDTLLLSGGARSRFFTDFAETLLGANAGTLHLVIDEAHLFAPQSGARDPGNAAMVHAANNLVSLGRSSGIRVMMLSQRPAKLHKDALTQAETLIAMRVVHPLDTGAIGAWVRGLAGAAEMVALLPSLQVGQGLIWSPALGIFERVSFPPIRTFDSGRPGAANQSVALAPIDVAAVRAAFAALKVDQNDEGGAELVLKAGARLLSPKSTKAQTEAPKQASVDEIAAAEARGYQRGFDAGVEAGRRQVVAHMRSGVDALENSLKRFEGGEVGALPIKHVVETGRMGGAVVKAVPQPNPKSMQKRQPTEAGGLNSAARKLLAVLDTNPPFRRTWQQAASLAGLRASGGHYNAGRKALRDAGFVIEEGDLVRIAAPSADAQEAVTDPAALVETWCRVLKGAAPKLLGALFHSGGRVARTAIAKELGMKPTGGHWNAGWKELRDNGIVTVSGDVAELTELFRGTPG